MKIFQAQKQREKEVYFSFPETLGISPICHCSLSREAGFPGWGNQAFKWIPPRGLLYWDLQTGKNPGEKGLLMCVHVLTLQCFKSSMVLSHLSITPTESPSKLPVSSPSPTGRMVTAVSKQGNQANDLENVWGALQDLGPHLQKPHPDGHQRWNSHCTNGMWPFSELMMIEQVESERQTASAWGRLTVWSSRAGMNLLFDHSHKKLSLVSQLENKWEPGASRFFF